MSSSLIARRWLSAASVPRVQNFIDGKFVDSSTDKWIDLYNPATNEVVCQVPESTQEEMHAAVAAAERAFVTWRETSTPARMRVMLKYQPVFVWTRGGTLAVRHGTGRCWTHHVAVAARQRR